MSRRLHHTSAYLLLLLSLLGGSDLIAQVQATQQKTRSLQEVIVAIESNTDYVFNYDPSLLMGNQHTGDLDVESIDQTLAKVFRDSPLWFEIDGETIIVYYPPPQTYRICGTLTGAIRQEPLVGATVSIVDTTVGTVTDHNGFFELRYAGDKDEKVTINYLGFKPIEFSLQDLADKDCPIYTMVIDKDIFGGEIIISDYLLDGISLGDVYTGFNLDFDLLSHNHSIVEHDLLKTAQLLPGVTSIDDSAANLQVRGSNPGQNLVLWEGVPLYNAGHVFGMVSAINPFSVDNVQIHKGAHHPRYDNRVGGILDISLSDDITSGMHGSVGTTMTELHSNLSIPIVQDQVKLELGGRRSINGIFDSPTLQSYTDKIFQYSVIDDQRSLSDLDFFESDQALSYSDWNAKVLYRPMSRLLISGGLYRNAQDFDYTFRLDGDSFVSEDIIALSTQILSLESIYNLTENWRTTLSVYQSSYRNDYKKIETSDLTEIDQNDQTNRINEQSITLSNDVNIGSHSLLNIGYELNQKEVVLDLGNDIAFDADFVPLEVEEAHFHNLFQSWSYGKDRLQFDIGNRSTYYQEFDRWFHSPRVNTKYALDPHLTVKADAGIYHQFVSQLTNLGFDQIKVDNPLWLLNSENAALSQEARKAAIGLVFQKGKWLIDLEGYYNRVDGISTIGPQLGILPDRVGFDLGRSTVIGLDALIKKRWSSGINSWISYSLGFANYDFPNLLPDPFPAPNDIRHNLSLVSSYTYRRFQCSINSSFHSGLPYTLSRLAPNVEDTEALPPFEYLLDYDAFNAERLDPYLRLDISASYRFDLNCLPGSQLELSCSILNMLDKTNYVAREYFVDYNSATDQYSASNIQKTLLGRTALVLIRFYW